jgi:Transglycosylase-like domain
MASEDINLAALWVPIMPELSHFNEKMKEAGEKAAAQLESGLKTKASATGSNIGSLIGAGLLEGFYRSDVTGKLEGAFGGVSLKTLGVASAVTGLVLGFGELADKLVDVGEEFVEINRNITLMSGTSGPALADLKEHADKLVSSLDTGTRYLGTDMATLATRLNAEAGPALDQLTRHVEELRDRFGALDIDKLTGAFREMGITGVQEADNALASLMLSAQAASEPLNTLIGDLTKAGPVGSDLGINIQQLGSLLAGLHARGEDAGAGVDLLQRALKSAKGEDLATFLKREIEYMEQYRAEGNSTAADQEANDVFGARKAREAIDAGQELLRVIREGPDAHKADSDAIDKTTEATKNLRNEWNEVSNKLRGDVQPAADAILDAITQIAHGLDWVLNQRFGWGPDNLPPAKPGVPYVPGAPPTGGPGTKPAPGAPSAPPSFAPWDKPSGYSGSSSGSGTNWDAIAVGESSSNWHANTGNGFYGGLQFTQSTWDMYKPAGAPARADQASREQQIAAAEATLSAQGPNAWPNTYHLGAPGSGGTVTTTGAVTTSGGFSMPGGANVTYTPSVMQGLGIPGLATNPAGGGNPVLPQWLQDFVQTYGGPGLTATSTPHGSLHGTPGSPDWATDVVGPQEQQDRLATYLLAHPELSAQMIHQSASGQPMGIAGGVNVSGRYYTTAGGTYGDEAGMVHWAPAGMPGGGGGPIPAQLTSAGGPRGLGPGGSPYVPGTGETAEQARARQRSVEDAQNRVDDYNDQINGPGGLIEQQKNADQQHREALSRRDDPNHPLIAGSQEYIKATVDVTKTETELSRINKELLRAKQQQQRAGQDLTDAETKQYDEANKPPPQEGKGKRGGGYGAAEELGSGLLSGIASSLGFPDVFGGKAPWDFGSVKLLEGIGNWGLSGIMGGLQKQQQAGGSPAAGIAAGLGKAFGLPGLGHAQFQGGAPGSGLAGGPPPGFAGPSGPGSAGFVSSYQIDNSMTVNGVPHPDTVDALKSLQNSAQRNTAVASSPGTFAVV